MRSSNPSRNAHERNKQLPRERSRHGESTIIANLILFIAVMGMASATVFVFKSMMDESTSAAAEEKDRTVGVMRTDFVIPSATYSAGQILIYAKNTGRQSFDPEDMDIYIDGLRIPRNSSNRTIAVVPDTDLYNIGTWDNGEDLEIVVFNTYSVPATHSVALYAPNGVKTENVFSS
jgi:archaellum component FlaG (FlaF/FlaG flagellin family)